MTKILKLTDKEMGIYEQMLSELEKMFNDEMYKDGNPYWAFSIEMVDDGRYEFNLESTFKDWLRTADHCCPASDEDGCSVCTMLIDLDILPDYEPESEE